MIISKLLGRVYNWGSFGGCKAYNVSGNRGVYLEYSDGKKLLIGSQKPEKFAEALDLVSGKRRP